MAKKAWAIVTLVKWSADEWGTAISGARRPTMPCDAANEQFAVAVRNRCAKFFDLETHAKKNEQTDKLPKVYGAFGDPDVFTKSLWRSIGDSKADDTLLGKVAHIPASQKSFKELARAERLKPGAIDALIVKSHSDRKRQSVVLCWHRADGTPSHQKSIRSGCAADGTISV